MESSLAELSVLFIDDEPLHLDLLKRIMNIIDPHIQVEILADPTKTIEKILKNHYDCVILDEKMPVLKGNEIIKMIKQVKDIPCIIYTGYDIDEVELKSGADTILQKYVNANYYPELIKTIRDTVENHQKMH
jgi:CheY-like chemotaxis protein